MSSCCPTSISNKFLKFKAFKFKKHKLEKPGKKQSIKQIFLDHISLTTIKHEKL